MTDRMDEAVQAVAHAIALKMQFRDFGHANAAGDWIVTSAQLDDFEAACNIAARAAIAAAMPYLERVEVRGLVDATDELKAAIEKFEASCRTSGGYMPAIATLLRIYADELADKYADDTNDGSALSRQGEKNDGR